MSGSGEVTPSCEVIDTVLRICEVIDTLEFLVMDVASRKISNGERSAMKGGSVHTLDATNGSCVRRKLKFEVSEECINCIFCLRCLHS